MTLLDFRYQDPWAKENFTLPDFVQQSQTSTPIYGIAIQSEKERYFQQFTFRNRWIQAKILNSISDWAS